MLVIGTGDDAMQMPSQEEQLIAEEYVSERPLTRPDTDVKKVVKCIILYIALTTAFGFITLYLFDWIGISALFSKEIIEFRLNHKVSFYIIYFLIICLFTGICCLRAAVIGCIRLYQHYAPEQVRRRCLFKPTCSEYAISAIKKYGLIIGGIKAYKRLFFRCRGNIYRIDYP